MLYGPLPMSSSPSYWLLFLWSWHLHLFQILLSQVWRLHGNGCVSHTGRGGKALSETLWEDQKELLMEVCRDPEVRGDHSSRNEKEKAL